MVFWDAAKIGRRDDPKAPPVAVCAARPGLLNDGTAGYRPEPLRSLLDAAASGGRLSWLQFTAPEVRDDFPRGIMARRTRDAAAGMRAGTAHVESLQWAAIVAVAQHGPGGKQLVQAERAVENVAADQTEGALQVERAHDLPAKHGCLEVRCVTVHQLDHDVGHFIAMLVPRGAVRQRRSDVLTEQARDVLAGRREAIVQGRGNE